MNLQNAIPIIRRRSNVERDSPTSYMAPDNSNSSSDPTSQCDPRSIQSSSTSSRVQSGELGQLRGNLSLRLSETYRELASVIRESHNGPSKLLLFIVPIAIVSRFVGLPAAAVFLLNTAALVPLAAFSTFTVLVLTRNAGFWGGLIRAVFGNAIELTVRRCPHQSSPLISDNNFVNSLVSLVYITGRSCSSNIWLWGARFYTHFLYDYPTKHSFFFFGHPNMCYTTDVKYCRSWVVVSYTQAMGSKMSPSARLKPPCYHLLFWSPPSV